MMGSDKQHTTEEIERLIQEKVKTLGEKVHLPRKQLLINRKRHRHTANEGMDSYR